MNLGEIVIQNFGNNQLMIKFSSKTDDINTIQAIKENLLKLDNQIKFEISATNFFLINLRTINSESTQIYNFSSLNLCLFGISEK